MEDKKCNTIDATSSSTPVSLHSFVTEDHVRAALSADKGINARLTAWNVVDFTKKGDNYGSFVSSVEVNYVMDGNSFEVVYVVKLNSGRNYGSAGRLNDIAFEKEYKFYSELAPQLNSALKEIGQREINIPKYLYGSLEREKEIIFLEDLRPRGYKMVDRRRGIDKAHTILVVEELARFHAASLLLQKKTDEDLVDKYPHLKMGMDYFICNYDAMLNMMQDNLKLVQEITKKVEGYKRVADWIDSILPRIADIFQEQTDPGESKILCHGDCWSNNLLFRYSQTGQPEGLMLLDLQIVNRSPPTVDLNYLLFTSMTGSVRKPNTEEFLRSYYATFSYVMEAADQKVPFTQEQLFEDFKARNLSGVLFAVLLMPLFIFETGDHTVDTTKDRVEEDFEEIMLEVREKTMATLDTNPVLKHRFLSIFDEMMELGMIP